MQDNEKVYDSLEPGAILPHLFTRYIGREIVYFETVDSTNNAARELALKGAGEGLVIIADSQTSGRGRLNRVWVTPRSSSIAFSMVLKPPIKPCDIPGITLVMGTAVCRALRRMGFLQAGIKWPNDIVLNNKKVCGILTEMSNRVDNVNYVVAGVGINVNTEEFPQEIRAAATSLSKESGGYVQRREVLVSVFEEFENLYDGFKAEGLKSIMDEYRSYSVILGNCVKVDSINESFNGEVCDITDEGLLVIRMDDGSLRQVISGDVSIRGMKGYV